jgi:23S rRNA (cytidine1920-2'-O)/16S rRNA (cytidine1409-2'-O)-methyltransferase
MKKRLDLLLVERGLAETRAKAQALVLAGRVRVPGTTTPPKAGMLLDEERPVELLEGARYVSRGGEKLEGALDRFGVDPRGKTAWDVGASTGGFTDCLLQRGAALVIAIDVGHGQLHWKLRQDPRVTNLEKVHIAKVAPGSVDWPVPDVVVLDLSFISLEKVLPPLARLIPEGTELLALVKPQFEAGPRQAPKGIVRDPEVRARVLAQIEAGLPRWGYAPLGAAPSEVKGTKGNQEYFLHFKRTAAVPSTDPAPADSPLRGTASDPD